MKGEQLRIDPRAIEAARECYPTQAQLASKAFIEWVLWTQPILRVQSSGSPSSAIPSANEIEMRNEEVEGFEQDEFPESSKPPSLDSSLDDLAEHLAGF